jgi:thiamine biosynthesis lipoprotein
MRLLIITIFLLLISLTACSVDDGALEMVEISGLSMGTLYSVKIIKLNGEIVETGLTSGISKILNNIEMTMSTYDPDSELSIFNRTQSIGWQDVSDELLQIVNAAIEVSAITEGAFDITTGTIVNLWGFGPDETSNKIPENETIEKALSITGSQYLELRHSPPSIRKLKPQIYLDLSGIAKGYAADEVASYLIDNGLNNYLVEIGGEIRAGGINQDNSSWRIAIETPDSSERAPLQIVSLNNTGMATSGDYRNYFEQNGTRYSHSIDPDSGSPVRHMLSSVTVIHPSSMFSDALATGLMVSGVEDGIRIAEENNLAAFFVLKTENDLEISYTSHFKEYLIH